MDLNLVFIAVGLFLISLTFIFKKQIDKFYDNLAGLSDRQKRYYKRVALRLPGASFIIVGIIGYFTGY